MTNFKKGTSSPVRRRRKGLVYWETRTPRDKHPMEVVAIPSFSARGMWLVYGRGDHFTIPNSELVKQVFGAPRIRWHLNTNMDILLRNKDGRVFVRFYALRRHHSKTNQGGIQAEWWKRTRHLDSRSYALIGVNTKLLEDKAHCDDSWVPRVVRDEYDDWATECVDYPDGDV